MKILVLNGNSDRNKKEIDLFSGFISDHFEENGVEVKSFLLRDMKIADCVGCFACWIKTPGICIHKDDMDEILKELIQSDKQLLISDVRFNLLSPVLMAVINRFLPLECAYMCLDNQKKSSHYSRYNNSWNPGLVIEDFTGREEQSLADISYCIRSNKNNAFLGTWIIGQNDEEVINAFNCY